MSAQPHSHDHSHAAEASALQAPHDLARYRQVLWVALAVNAAMFLIEAASGLRAGSSSLLADAIDFAGDAASYGVSLAVLSAGLGWRARTAQFKAACMMGFGVFVLGRAAWGAWTGVVPDAAVMGAISLLALAANLGVAWILYAFRNGDANMRSVWLCSRNDAFGNLAVLAAALAVAGTHTVWPDLVVAAIMASLALSGGWSVMRQARGELAAHSAGHLH